MSGCYDNTDDDLWEQLITDADKSDKPKPEKDLNDFDMAYDWSRFESNTVNKLENFSDTM